jgi:replicative DNA helicase
MAEERIAERIDANLMDIPMDDVIALSRDRYLKKLDTIRQTSTGRLLIKEYPTAAAHTGHFRALLHELKLKQNFTPDILFVDYLSICASSRLKLSGAVNTYLYNKSIAEELRGLAVEMKIPIFTAAQFNRDGSSATDPGLDKISESFAIAQTADFIFAMTTSEELEKNNQIQAYVLKNRYAKRQSYQKFILGIDTSRMKLYDTGMGVQPTAAPPEDFAAGSFAKPTFARSRRRPLSHLKTDDE